MSNLLPHAVVVGGTKGLGRIVTERFLANGFSVTVLSRNGTQDNSEKSILQNVKVDLETLDDASALVVEALKDKGPLRYLVFCQRYRGTGDPWKGEIQVGLTATRLLIEGFAPHFAAGHDCAIGVASSVYAEFVGSSQPVGYHVVKAGLNQLVRYYAVALGEKRIRVNAIMPLTYIKPEAQEYYNSQPDLIKVYENFVPLKRLGKAKDSANLLEFLCSEKAAFVTGQSIFVDGGVSLIWPEEMARKSG